MIKIQNWFWFNKICNKVLWFVDTNHTIIFRQFCVPHLQGEVFLQACSSYTQIKLVLFFVRSNEMPDAIWFLLVKQTSKLAFSVFRGPFLYVQSCCCYTLCSSRILMRKLKFLNFGYFAIVSIDSTCILTMIVRSYPCQDTSGQLSIH